MENYRSSNSSSGRMATAAWLGANLPLAAWLSLFHGLLAPRLAGEQPGSRWHGLASLFVSARPPSSWLVSAMSHNVPARLEPWTALGLAPSPHSRHSPAVSSLDRSYQPPRRGKPRGRNSDVLIASDSASSPMATRMTSPLAQEPRGGEPGDFRSDQELTLPNFSPSSGEIKASFGNAVQVEYPEERTGILGSPWSIPAKIFGVLSRFVSGQVQAPPTSSSVRMSHGMGVSGDHAPASDSWPGSALHIVAPVYGRRSKTKGSSTAMQNHTTEHRDESAPQRTGAAPVGATAVWPIGRLGEEMTRALVRWQGKSPAVSIAFLTHPDRAQKAPGRTATGAADEDVSGRDAPGEMPFMTSSNGNMALAESISPAGNATDVRLDAPRFPVTRGIELTTHERTESARSSAHDWPVLNLLPRLLASVSRGASASEPSRRIANAIPALQSLSALGPGEPLVEPVRPVMEKLIGRDLSQVRVFSSPAAEALGAEAFTSGQRIVFAPGRMDLRSSRGLALLGHELAHLGQPLALKSNWMDALSDTAELVALEQESTIQRLFDGAGITPPRMDLLRVASEPRRAEQSGRAESNATISGELDTSPIASADFSNVAAVPAGLPPATTVHVPSRQTAEVPVAAPSSPAATPPSTPPDVDALARKVYDLLKDRLRSERERHELYSR